MYTIIDEVNLNSDGQQVNEYQQNEVIFRLKLCTKKPRL